jgi:hypothetical protein
MTIVGVLTLISSVRGSITKGGLIPAIAGISTAVFGRLLSSLADRHRQRPVLLIASFLNVVSLIGVVLPAYSCAFMLWVGAAVFVLGERPAGCSVVENAPGLARHR